MRIESLAGVWSAKLLENQFNYDAKSTTYHATQQAEHLGSTEAKASEVDASITLPATTDEAKLGRYNELEGNIFLKRDYPFIGTCIYERSFEVREEEKGNTLFLELERTKGTKVFLDGVHVSSSLAMMTRQRHLLSTAIEVGTHVLTIEVNNDLHSISGGYEEFINGHQFTEHTQTNWNGIIGKIELCYYESASIGELVYRYNHEQRSIELSMGIAKDHLVLEHAQRLSNDLCVKVMLNGKCKEVTMTSEVYNQESGRYEIVLSLDYFFSDSDNQMKLWSEFDPTVYDVETQLCMGDHLLDIKKATIGFSYMRSEGRTLIFNDRRLWLRGDIDCCIYPITGYAPMEVAMWEDRFKKMKDYGLNHCRFHSWCPPEAAFIAADSIGIYLQVELPCFATKLTEEGTELTQLLYDEAVKLINAYGHHPSFTIFAIGNEMNGDRKIFEALLVEIKKHRKDLLYSNGANNFLNEASYIESEDLFIGMRLPRDSKTEPIVTVRGSNAHLDLPLGHIQESDYIGTDFNYDAMLKNVKKPFISHEVGQFQFYPDIEEIKAYTGVLKSSALELWRKEMEEKQLSAYMKPFFDSAGHLAIDCYREDIEAALRSNEMSGFQLLSLMDFSGQGTAFVGILNSFYESKGLITKEAWRQFCGPTVIMASYQSSIITVGEVVDIDLRLYHYGEEAIEGGSYEVSLSLDETMAVNTLAPKLIFKEDKKIEGRIFDTCAKVGHVTIDLSEYSEVLEELLRDGGASAVLEVMLKDEKGTTICQNSYQMFLYTQAVESEVLDTQSTAYEVYDQLDQQLIDKLEGGENVLVQLLESDSYPKQSMLYPTDFWNYAMFKELCIDNNLPVAPGTMGLCIDKEHPIFNAFPTKTYAQMQWKRIVNDGNSLIFSELDKSNQEVKAIKAHMKPIVHVIDHFERNEVLGLIYEVVGYKGRCLVTTIDFECLSSYAEVDCLHRSMTNYLIGGVDNE